MILTKFDHPVETCPSRPLLYLLECSLMVQPCTFWLPLEKVYRRDTGVDRPWFDQEWQLSFWNHKHCSGDFMISCNVLAQSVRDFLILSLHMYLFEFIFVCDLKSWFPKFLSSKLLHLIWKGLFDEFPCLKHVFFLVWHSLVNYTQLKVWVTHNNHSEGSQVTFLVVWWSVK